MPLVLVHNEVVRNPAHRWNDIEGVQYHYPSNYQSIIQPGERFVYYRGVHRVGGKRAAAVYIGAGRIGAVRADPATENASRKAWYCDIENYARFEDAVPAKFAGTYFEEIPRNQWRNGVRLLPDSTYEAIIANGQLGSTTIVSAETVPSPAVVTTLIEVSQTSDTAKGGGRRLSKRAKLIGDAAEAIALRYITAQSSCTAITHRAALGETPGWDIDYMDQLGQLQRIEVKGTVLGAFASIEMTAAELRAAEHHGESYWLCLVAHCLTATPRLQMIQDPAKQIRSGGWAATPTSYSIRLASSAEG